MKKQNLLIILIVVCGITGIAYATSSHFTNMYIVIPTVNTTNINILNKCNGCNVFNENSYSNYNTVLLNTTVSLSSPDSFFTPLYINDNGYIIGTGNFNTVLISPTGALIESHSTPIPIPGNGKLSSMSENGEYQIITDASGKTFIVYKNGALLQTLGLKTSNFNIPSIVNGAISPDGHYIVAIGEDAGGILDRVVIFQGS